jgi:hypothetical protein
MKWTNARCKELDALRELLTEVQSINRGSHVIERLERCIALAKKLDATNMDKPRPSFYRFLNDLAAADRSSAAGQGEKK